MGRFMWVIGRSCLRGRLAVSQLDAMELFVVVCYIYWNILFLPEESVLFVTDIYGETTSCFLYF